MMSRGDVYTCLWTYRTHMHAYMGVGWVAVWLLLWLLHQTEGVLRFAFGKGLSGIWEGEGGQHGFVGCFWCLFVCSWFRR